MIRFYQEADYAAMSRRAAHIIAAEVYRNPACVLGLATGSTPIGTYENLVAWNKAGDLSFKEVKTVNLDEYKGLSGEHDQSYRYFMNTNLFDHIDIDKANTSVPNGLAEDADAEGSGCERGSEQCCDAHEGGHGGDHLEEGRSCGQSALTDCDGAFCDELQPDADEREARADRDYLKRSACHSAEAGSRRSRSARGARC